MIESGSLEWSSPRKCPISWLMIDSRSCAPTIVPCPSVSPTSSGRVALISMSTSTISPSARERTVVEARSSPSPWYGQVSSRKISTFAFAASPTNSLRPQTIGPSVPRSSIDGGSPSGGQRIAFQVSKACSVSLRAVSKSTCSDAAT